MKKVLLSIFFAAVYTFAGTCTEILFARMAPFYGKADTVYLDSAYHKSEFTNGVREMKVKYYYKDSFLDSVAYVSTFDGVPEKGYSDPVYYTPSGTQRRGVGYEFVFAVEKKGDTTITKVDYYVIDSLAYTEMFFEYDKGSQKVIRDSTFFHEDNQFNVRESIFDDYIIIQNVTNAVLGTEGEETYKFFETERILYEQDGKDDLKCASNHLDRHQTETAYQVIYNDNGFVFQENDSGILYEYIYIKQENKTAIPLRRPPVKISPKARYFDLLGRYKFSK